MEKLILTPDEARNMLQENTSTIYRMLKSGEIPAYRSGNNWKIPLKTLERYIENKALNEAKVRREMAKNEKEML